MTTMVQKKISRLSEVYGSIRGLRDHPAVDEKVEFKNSVQTDLLQERYRIAAKKDDGFNWGNDKIQGIFFSNFFIERFQVGDTV